MCSADIFLGLLAILFPPLPVWVKTGICSADSIINILLCMLGFIPGLIHAWYIIAKFPEPEYEYQRAPNDDDERVTYVIVHGSHGGRRGGPNANKPGRTNNMTYGTAGGNSSQNPAQAAPKVQSQQQQHQGQQGGASNSGEGSSDGAAPPSYAQVVAGDNKVQSQD